MAEEYGSEEDYVLSSVREASFYLLVDIAQTIGGFPPSETQMQSSSSHGKTVYCHVSKMRQSSTQMIPKISKATDDVRLAVYHEFLGHELKC
ncbi:hypothetical protein AVEN_159208-1 [Araneus ventricosus]|uniref:Uncharacterized protein n=1 Tax=Araneus ventricosus TaxID=182803 RepID=A0A4Y2P3B0_ARAVE|nr:hypothetical protein AVEN_159208-1 [Araneus ventricosus]